MERASSLVHVVGELVSLRVERAEERVTVVLADHVSRSRLGEAVVRHLRVVDRDGAHSLDAALQARAAPGDVTVAIGDRIVARAPAGRDVEASPLTSFETRFLADQGVPHPGGHVEATGEPLRTDLHTHFAGAVSATDLVELGVELGVEVSPRLLREAGVHVASNDPVRLGSLGDAVLARYAAALSVPVDRRVPFVDMERIYRLRAPITKCEDAFVPLCRRVARDYSKMGATYAELSLSNVVESPYLAAIHAHMPSIEEETGVTIRFLAALSRHDDLEWDLDLIDRMKEIAASRYLAGVDFMGHETNSTRAFARQLLEVAAWADAHRPGFAVRVHAGENPAHPENVRVAAECVAGKRVALRVGHGLHGADDRALEALRAAGAIVEFNLSSNLALNNIQSALDTPILRYLDAEIPVVLGTDGYGVYQTTLPLEVRAARIAGLTDAHVDRVRAAETAYVEAQRATELRGTVAPRSFVVPGPVRFAHYSPVVVARKEAEAAGRARALDSGLEAVGVTRIALPDLRAWVGSSLAVSFAGAWRKSWEATAPALRDSMRDAVRTIVDGLPDDAIVITGGTNVGLENEVHFATRGRGLRVLGWMVETTPPEWIAGVTHVTVTGKDLHAKAAGLYALLGDVQGIALFFGGGPIVLDEIQAARNLGVRYLVMGGVGGASETHAARHRGRAFRTGEEALARLRLAAWTTDEALFHPGVNPTVDVTVTRLTPGGAREVLLVKRAANAASEHGRWALPGGFVRTDSPRGEAWRPGRENAEAAAARVVESETGMNLRGLGQRLVRVGTYSGRRRDPRDTGLSWTETTAFAIELPRLHGVDAIASGDGGDATWFAVSALPRPLAFDHDELLAASLDALGAAKVIGVRPR